MPTYDYQCAACKKRFEVRQAITERPLRRCVHCGQAAARRLIGAGAGILFRGSGFYCTDYRKSQKKTPSDGEKKSKESSEGSTGEKKSKESPEGSAGKEAKGAPPRANRQASPQGGK